MDESKELLDTSAMDFGAEGDGFEKNLDALRGSALMIRDSVFNLGSRPESVTVVMEDLSVFMARTAHALRLQGAFRAMLRLLGFTDVVMVMPAKWQIFFGWRKTPGVTPKGFAKFACTVLGYQPMTPTVGKQTVDVRDAILIARWYSEVSTI